MNTQSSNFISTQAPAKVNLTLAVLGRRPDHFYEIESWVVKIAWFDRLTFCRSSELRLAIQSDRGGLSADESNLVLRAARALARESGHAAEAAITLEKKIPIGAGLGGGSSDAAATLRGLNELWGLRWTIDSLKAVARRIGSDVPLFIEEAPAVVIRGRGERVEPLSSSWKGWVAIIVPAYSISTAAVYGVQSKYRSDERASTKPWMEPNRAASELQVDLFNDLEPAAIACEPRLAALLKTMDAIFDRRVLMTGSGSCLFAIFDSRMEAEAWRCEAIKQAQQPVRIEIVPVL